MTLLRAIHGATSLPGETFNVFITNYFSPTGLHSVPVPSVSFTQ